MIGTTAAIIMAIAGGAQVAGSVYAAKKQSGAANHAADLTTQAANRSAELQAESNAAALAFEREQADRDRIEAEQIQRANYDQWAAGAQNSYAADVASAKNARAAAVQGGHNTYNTWAAREGRIGQLGELLGNGPRYVPKYEELPPLEVPTLNIPGYAGPGSSGGGGYNGPRTGQNFDPAYIGQQVDAVYAAHGLKATGPGTGPTDRAYMVDAILKNKGWEPYWQTRISDEIRKAGLGNGYQGNAGALMN